MLMFKLLLPGSPCYPFFPSWYSSIDVIKCNIINPFNSNFVVCSFKLLLIRMLSGTEKLRRKVGNLSLCAEVLHSNVSSLYNSE